MLIYHPAQDVNHCVYRILLMLERSVHETFDIELYRLLDFYFLFPHFLKFINPFPSEFRAYFNLVKQIPEPYESLINTKRILFELESLQSVAIQSLLAKNILELEAYKEKKLKRSETKLPFQIVEVIAADKVAEEGWFRLIVNEFPLINFAGQAGLKKRTGLMEYRYDMEKKNE
ncbi:hypothetical protein KFZ76_11780 [Methylovulum psychrotolerans]|uniref:ABC-three component system middle component 5 n=1 Tax=Methylovulum psychrotolerans TaxID=1704499 RepID=UPI001BFF16B7|nr:ABC-three component system middle component 5 [Methylovulum psychrotolerans]MBT9098386.1 hypothetical protein [Methylovulum psychrotolerans]